MVRIDIPSELMNEFESTWKNEHKEKYFFKKDRTQMVISCLLKYMNKIKKDKILNLKKVNE